MRKLTPEEFSEVGTAGLENPSSDDFRKLILNAEIINTQSVNNKKLVIPDILEFKEVLNKTDDRYWFGNSSYQNNDGEDFSKAEKSIVIYYKGLNEIQIKEMMKPLKIQIGWITQKGNKVEKEYSIGEILTFENGEN